MPDLTDAIEAAMHTMYGDHPHAENYRAHVQVGIAAAAPLIEAQVRAKVAEEVATDILARLAAIGLRPTPWADGYTLASQYAAAVSRKHATKAPESHGGATAPPPESERTSNAAETLSGRSGQEGQT